MSGSSFFASVGSLVASRGVLIFSQLLILPVIARFLSTEDFGAFALAMSVVVFAQILSDAGLGRSLIRQPEVNDLEWSSVFWILTAVGAGLAAILLLSAPLWARFFELPTLQGLVSALAVVPFLSALAAIPSARLERDHHFPTLALIRTTSALLGLAAAVAFAIGGAGAWALVAQQLVLAGCLLIGTMASSSFRPLPAFSADGIGQHILFARDTIGTSLLLTVQRQAPLVLIGSVLGAAPLGLFEMARRLLGFPARGLTGPVGQVVYVRMARSISEPQEVGALYVSTIRLFAILLIPPMAILATTGHVVFPAILSQKWLPVADVFLLAAAGFTLETVVSIGGTAMQVTGHTTLRLKMQTERAVLRTIAIAAAVPFGIEAVALTISLFVVLFLPRYWHFVRLAAPFDRKAATKTILSIALVSLIGCLGFLLLVTQLAPGVWLYLGCAGGVLLLVWVVCLALHLGNVRRDITLLKR